MKDTYAGRVPSFRGLGTLIPEGTDTRSMLQIAKLDNWNVRTVPAREVIDGHIVPYNMFFTVRDTYSETPMVLGSVKSRYVPVQNETAFSWVDGILDGGGKWDTAGSFNNSAVVFGALEIDEAEVVIDRGGLNDAVKMYLLVSNSHDGSRPLQASITPIRVTCQNTLNMALKTTKQSFKVRHTSSAEARSMAARDALDITFQYSKEFGDLANRMYQTKLENYRFDSIIKQLFPKPEPSVGKDGKINNAGVTRWENTVNTIYDLRLSSTNRDIDGTVWGAYNVLTERLDWFRQGDNDEAKAMASSGFSSALTEEKQKILDVLLAASGIL